MNRFDSINFIEILELNSFETKNPRPKLSIREHWNVRDYVVLEFDNTKITVSADQLKRAIDNAKNAHR